MEDLELNLAADSFVDIFCASADSCMLRMDEEIMGTAIAERVANVARAISISTKEKPGSPGIFTFSFVMRKTSPYLYRHEILIK